MISFSRDEPLNKWQYNHLGGVIEFAYGATLGRRFSGKEKLAYFQSWGFEQDSLLPSKDVVVMVDNHDKQREHESGYINYRDPRLYKVN